jgi:hypothetical protein
VQLVEERRDEWLIEFTAWGYTGAVEAYCGVLPVADRSVLNYADYTLIDTSLRAGTHTAVIPAPTDKLNYEVWVQLRQEGKKTEGGFGHYQEEWFVKSAGDDTTGTGSETNPLLTPQKALTTLKTVYTNAHFWPGKGTVDPSPASIVILDPVSSGPTSAITGIPPLTLYARTPDAAGDITLNANGALLTVGSGVTLTLKDITLKGKSDNNGLLVQVNTGGELVLENGAVITGNTGDNGGGVQVAGGTLTMTGGKISGNTRGGYGATGAGVYMSGGDFTMSGGEISGNYARDGGGGVVMSGGAFTMNGGEIKNNSAQFQGGGGVRVNGGSFTMYTGTISGNGLTGSVSYNGGGVYLGSGAFTMYGGEIRDNTGANNTNKQLHVAGGTAQWNQNSDGVLVALASTNNNIILPAWPLSP